MKPNVDKLTKNWVPPSTGYRCSIIDALHDEIMNEFHKQRGVYGTAQTTLTINGSQLAQLIAHARKNVKQQYGEEHPAFKPEKLDDTL
jgi:hypothetical protein